MPLVHFPPSCLVRACGSVRDLGQCPKLCLSKGGCLLQPHTQDIREIKRRLGRGRVIQDSVNEIRSR